MEQNFFDIDPRLEKLGEQAQLDCAQAFARTEEIGEYNSRKVLAAFLHNGVSENCGSLKEFGIEYRQVDLLPDGTPDLEAIAEAVKDPRVKVAYVQRSRGYSLRPSINMDMMGKLIQTVRKNNPKAIFMVDN